MTEIDITRLGKWWNSVSRFFWSGLGVLCATGGVIQLLRDGDRVWGWMMISTGIAITVLPLTFIKCARCGFPNSFEYVWKIASRQQQFTCHACGTEYRLPMWNRILLNIIIYGYGFLTLASGCNQFIFNSIVRSPSYLIVVGSFPLPWALAMLLVRFSQYEK